MNEYHWGDFDDYLRFTQDWRIPPDNNSSEHNIRYLSNSAKHGKHFFEVLVMLAEGHPWLPAAH